jgi:hypothetical protein
MTKHVKLFEAYSGQPGQPLEYSFDRYEIDTYFPKKLTIKAHTGKDNADDAELANLGLANGLIEIEDSSVDTVKIRFNMAPIYDRSGIGSFDFELISVYIAGDYSVWNEVNDDSTRYDFEIEDAGPFYQRVEVTWEGFPLYPYNIEIEMADNYNLDPSKLTYKIQIGN